MTRKITENTCQKLVLTEPLPACSSFSKFISASLRSGFSLSSAIYHPLLPILFTPIPAPSFCVCPTVTLMLDKLTQIRKRHSHFLISWVYILLCLLVLHLSSLFHKQVAQSSSHLQSFFLHHQVPQSQSWATNRRLKPARALTSEGLQASFQSHRQTLQGATLSCPLVEDENVLKDIFV